MEERLKGWRQSQVHTPRALREPSLGCSSPQNRRPKAQELYSDQPGKSPAGMTLASCSMSYTRLLEVNSQKSQDAAQRTRRGHVGERAAAGESLDEVRFSAPALICWI